MVNLKEWLFKTLFKDKFERMEVLVSHKSDLTEQLIVCQHKLHEKQELSEREIELLKLEEELNSKYPKKLIIYKGRFIPNHGRCSVDVRNFFSNPDSQELKFAEVWKDLPDDEKAFKCLKWVIDNITYISDKEEFDMDEYWCFPYELLNTRKGDCDDGAILLSNLMASCGIPYWKVRLTCGDTPDGGHAYVTYFRESDKTWVNLDWCYFPSKKLIKDRTNYKEEKHYGDVWFSWNRKYSFSKGVK